MYQPLISVIIPIYNAERYLNRCVESIQNQTYKNIEIVLVDDGSKDNSTRICDNLANLYSHIHVIHKQNAGAPAARNTGLQYANGDLIAFVDADDWIDSNMYSDMVSRLLCDKSDIVICGNRWIRDDEIVKIESFNSCTLDVFNALDQLLNNNIKEQVWDKIYTKEVLKDLFFVEGKKIDDVFWTYRVIGNSNKVSVINRVYYNYYQNSESVMGQGYRAYWTDALDAMKLRCEYIKDKFPDLYDKALYVYIGSCHYQLQCAIRTQQDKSVIENILNRLNYRKTGNPCKEITTKQKIWYCMFSTFPVMTSKFRNFIKVGL